jgi:hypothetical protein
MAAGLFISNLDLFGVGQIFVTQAKVLPVWLGILYVLSKRWRTERAA